jgi:hypothetical protein
MHVRAILFSLILFFSNLPGLFAGPANPNATAETKALLQYLVSLSGTKILSGQESMWNDGSGFSSNRDKYVYERTGKYPALYTSDFGDFGTGNLSDRSKVVSNAITYHKKGYIIAFQYHMIKPDLAAVITQDEVSISTSVAQAFHITHETIFSHFQSANPNPAAVYSLTGQRITMQQSYQGISMLKQVSAGMYVIRDKSRMLKFPICTYLQ